MIVARNATSDSTAAAAGAQQSKQEGTGAATPPGDQPTGAGQAPRPNAAADTEGKRNVFPLARDVVQLITRLVALAAAGIALHQVLTGEVEQERKRSHERRVMASVGTKDDFFEILMSPHDSPLRKRIVASLVSRGSGDLLPPIDSVPIKALPPAQSKPKDGRKEISVDQFVAALLGHERVVFFLGDGCSVSSGFPTRKQLLQKESWRHTFASWTGRPGPTWDEFLAQCYPTPADRHQLYARLRKSSKPSQGYRHLAELMQATWPKMSLMLTTNFDDLLRQAHGSKNFHVVSCTRTGLAVGLPRDVNASSSSKYNELVKLHGDYIDRTVNTVEELTDPVPADLRSALEYRLSQFPTALVFVGYDGEDENIAVMLNAMRLRGPMNVYWVSGQQYADHTPLGRWFNSLPAVTWVDWTDKLPDAAKSATKTDKAHPFDSLMKKLFEAAEPLAAAADLELQTANNRCSALETSRTASNSEMDAAEADRKRAADQMEKFASRWRSEFKSKPHTAATEFLPGNADVFPKYSKINWSPLFDQATRVVIVADYLSRGWVSDNQAKFTELIKNGATIDFIFPDYRDEDAMKVLVQRFPNNFKSPKEARERLELQFIPDLHRTLAHAILDAGKQFSIADAASPVHVRYFEGGIINYPFYYFEYATTGDTKPHADVLCSHFEHSRWTKIGSPLMRINLHADGAAGIRQHIENDIQTLIATSRLASEPPTAAAAAAAENKPAARASE